jgi:hypothetical protein
MLLYVYSCICSLNGWLLYLGDWLMQVKLCVTGASGWRVITSKSCNSSGSNCFALTRTSFYLCFLTLVGIRRPHRLSLADSLVCIVWIVCGIGLCQQHRQAVKCGSLSCLITGYMCSCVYHCLSAYAA